MDLIFAELESNPGKLAADGGNLAAELDKHWIKEGNEVRALHRKEPVAHPLMVSVDGDRHRIPKGLTEKIYVEVLVREAEEEHS